MNNNKLTEIPVTEADIQTVLDAFDYRTGIDSHAEYIVRCALAELQERRKADSVEPVYQYRIRNGYNGQVTEWQTIRRDQVDFVLKAQSLNAEFRIIPAPQPAPVVNDEVGSWNNHKNTPTAKSVSENDKVPTVSFYRDGIEAAANWVDHQREIYDSKHGRQDPDTGAFEFGSDIERDYSDTFVVIAEGIRALHPNAGIPPAPVMPDSENGLMSCPFCGGKARQLTIEQDNDPHFGGDVITCAECGASSHVEFGFKENLKSAWNSRAAMLKGNVQ
ncbi:TPA: Lar family restriction alleviation protein [Salmonella enterica subsp. enterica serovar Saintpaul]